MCCHSAQKQGAVFHRSVGRFCQALTSSTELFCSLSSVFILNFLPSPQGCRRILKNVTRVKTNTVMAPWICKSCGILAQKPWKCSFPFSQSCGFCNLSGVEYLTLQIQHYSPRICNSDTGGRLSFLFSFFLCLA